MGKIKSGDLIVNVFDYDSPVTIKYGILLDYCIDEAYRKTKKI